MGRVLLVVSLLDVYSQVLTMKCSIIAACLIGFICLAQVDAGFYDRMYMRECEWIGRAPFCTSGRHDCKRVGGKYSVYKKSSSHARGRKDQFGHDCWSGKKSSLLC